MLIKTIGSSQIRSIPSLIGRKKNHGILPEQDLPLISDISGLETTPQISITLALSTRCIIMTYASPSVTISFCNYPCPLLTSRSALEKLDAQIFFLVNSAIALCTL